MAKDFKSLFFQKRFVDFVFLSIRKFDEVMAANALGVMMRPFIIDVFKVMMFIAKGGFADNAGLKQFMKASIDGGAGDFSFSVFELFD